MNKKVMGLSFITILIIVCGFIVTSRSEKVYALDEVKLQDFLDNSSGMFAIMVENSSGSYVAYSGTTWPSSYTFNSDESGCLDNNGQFVSDALSFNSSTNTATVDVGQTSFCYLYFDL